MKSRPKLKTINR